MRTSRVSAYMTMTLLAATLCCPCRVALAEAAEGAGEFPGAVRLVLPPVVYATPGIECNLYFDNLILTLNPANFAFDVAAPKGLQFQERWAFTPTDADTGDYPIVVEVRNDSNTVVARSESTLRVAAPPTQANPASILIVGDSLTESSVYPGHVLALSEQDGGLRLRMVGSRGPGNMPPTGGLRHEGYSGWTAQAFATSSGPLSRSGYHRRGATGSPFLYEAADGSRALDVARYCEEFNCGQGPDLLTIGLGTNDVFNADDQTIDMTIDVMLKHYDALVDSVLAALPGTRLGVQLPNPPSRSQDGFRNYTGPGRQTRHQYRRNQHRLVERLVEHYGGREQQRLYLVPNYVNLDVAHGFPTWSSPIHARSDETMTRVNNGTHPSDSGYRQIGDAVYSWAVAMLAEPH